MINLQFSARTAAHTFAIISLKNQQSNVIGDFGALNFRGQSLNSSDGFCAINPLRVELLSCEQECFDSFYVKAVRVLIKLSLKEPKGFVVCTKLERLTCSARDEPLIFLACHAHFR